jgi:hypothetical protein
MDMGMAAADKHEILGDRNRGTYQMTLLAAPLPIIR